MNNTLWVDKRWLEYSDARQVQRPDGLWHHEERLSTALETAWRWRWIACHSLRGRATGSGQTLLDYHCHICQGIIKQWPIYGVVVYWLGHWTSEREVVDSNPGRSVMVSCNNSVHLCASVIKQYNLVLAKGCSCFVALVESNGCLPPGKVIIYEVSHLPADCPELGIRLGMETHIECGTAFTFYSLLLPNYKRHHWTASLLICLHG